MSNRGYGIKWKSIISSGIDIVTGVIFAWVPKLVIFTIYELTGNLKDFAIFFDYSEESKYFKFFAFISESKCKDLLLNMILIVLVFILTAALIWQIKKIVGKKLLIIEHSSLQKMNFEYLKEDIEGFSYKKKQIDQYEILNNDKISLDIKISLLIKNIDENLGFIRKNIESGYQIAYAGIANIPATFYLGYKLGDENRKFFFHKYRTSTDDYFHLLKETNSCTKLKTEILQESDKSCERDIVLVVQLTQPISKEDLTGIINENDYLVKYYVSDIDYDVVNSVGQIDNYCKQIMEDVNSKQKENNIRNIKICLAASSAFVFALGTRFSASQNKETIIYSFERNRYTWGINISKSLPVIN